MNFRVLARVLGTLLVLLGMAMGLCLAYAWWGGEATDGFGSIQAFAISIGVTLLAAGVLLFFARGSGRDLLRKEAVAVVGLGWALCSLFGALPYVMAPPGLN